MNLEGKVYGYSKKMLALIVLFVFVSGVMFYAGAKYEKRKLSNLGLLKSSQTGKTKKKTPETPTAENAPAPDNQTETIINTPADPNAVPTSTTKPTAIPSNLQN